MQTHVVSAILNINQNVDEEWPLQILDHDGQLHHVLLQPGEMLWYESGRMEQFPWKKLKTIFS